jgi:mannitol-specific phosphotransferase system IIBC component
VNLYQLLKQNKTKKCPQTKQKTKKKNKNKKKQNKTNKKKQTKNKYKFWFRFMVLDATFNNISTLVVICTDCIGSCESNYHTIMTTRPHHKQVNQI